MWTDMSEIVRPTRDGIHGREFISTAVDLGEKPDFLTLDLAGRPTGEVPRVLSLPVPFLFDIPPQSAESEALYQTLTQAAQAIQSLAVVPIRWLLKLGIGPECAAPLVAPSEIDALEGLGPMPRLVELDGWDEDAYQTLRDRHPTMLVCVRLPFDAGVIPLARKGIRLFHLTADYHGRIGSGFVLDAIREVHEALVGDGLRERVTLVGSGGIIAAEHVPKAIICGLDAAALDTTAVIALQGRFRGECTDRRSGLVQLPAFRPKWGAQRLMNLAASWRDQMLEVLGAMGLREVRRLRGETGRAMFQADLEREAFAGIEGYA
jgi:hypothetical protein